MPPSQSQFTSIRDLVLSQNNLDDICESYEAKGMITSFKDVKRQYVEYLIVKVASKAFNKDTMPSLQVEALWRIHLMETENYRSLEKIIIEKVNSDSPISAGNMEHIEHSSLKTSDMNTNDRLSMTKTMYMFMNFEFHDERDEEMKADAASSHALMEKKKGSILAHNEIETDSEIGDFDIVKRLKTLEMKNVPGDIRPIQSLNNKSGYKGVRRTGTKNSSYFSAILWKGTSHTIYHGTDLEAAGTMFGKSLIRITLSHCSNKTLFGLHVSPFRKYSMGISDLLRTQSLGGRMG
jgi:hypothetical protein